MIITKSLKTSLTGFGISIFTIKKKSQSEEENKRNLTSESKENISHSFRFQIPHRISINDKDSGRRARRALPHGGKGHLPMAPDVHGALRPRPLAALRVLSERASRIMGRRGSGQFPGGLHYSLEPRNLQVLGLVPVFVNTKWNWNSSKGKDGLGKAKRLQCYKDYICVNKYMYKSYFNELIQKGVVSTNVLRQFWE